MGKYLVSREIKKANPYTPQQNSKAQTDDRTIVGSTQTMPHAKSLSLDLWTEAVNTVVYVLNQTVLSWLKKDRGCLRKSLDKTAESMI